MQTLHRQSFYEKYVKRLFDIVLAVLVIVLLSWLYAFLAILVRMKLGKPVLFKQQRPGMIDPKTGKERIFELYKFRTMTDERDMEGNLLPVEVRLTPFGKKLRASSLDELPEAFAILKGDMSFIGPRPLLVRYLDRFNEEQHHRHDVKPGLTGYAQAHGRNTLSWEDKFAMDVWYSKNVSFIVDIKIVLDTIKCVLKHEGINSEISTTMPEFCGTPEGVISKWKGPNKEAVTKHDIHNTEQSE